MAETVHAGAPLVVRLHPSTRPLCQPDETPLDVGQALQQQASGTRRSLPGRVGPATQRVAGWVQAYRRSAEHANTAGAAGRPRHRKKGHTPPARTVFVAAWGLGWTSRPPEVRSAATVLRLYRGRWPVALASKRGQSLRDLEVLRARHGRPLADLWRHGKLLEVRLGDKHLRRPLGAHWGALARERTAPGWRPWKLMHQALIPRLPGAVHWPEQGWSATLAVLAERPRHRTLQRLPEALWVAPSHGTTDLTPLEAEDFEDARAA